MLNEIVDKVMNLKQVEEEETHCLINAPLEDLCGAANRIRKYFCGNVFEICSIINAKSGKCSENCKFCSQSSHYKSDIEAYPLMGTDKILEEAIYNDKSRIQRFSLVTSGRKLNESEISQLSNAIKKIKSNTKLKICASCGLLSKNDIYKLKEAGLTRYHNNIESSEQFFPSVCSSHTINDKVQTITFADELGLEICSGGIMGLGESWNDRVHMAFLVKRLKTKSIPINMLNPIPGTPFEHNKILSINEMRRICAIFRFINPDAFIRLAGGRGLLSDKGRSCLLSGANALISGNMLTTAGVNIEADLEMIKELGYYVEK
ncbi:MAG: biotin synthase BioB [Alphaproteobacteria bacterium]|nr:biotin synthase BioB [Alphaproteobacteria bacterium]